MGVVADNHCAPETGADQEAGKCDEGSDEGETRSTGDGKSDEYDVAGHIGYEDPAELQDADRVDDARAHRQQQEQRGQRALGQSRLRPGTPVASGM